MLSDSLFPEPPPAALAAPAPLQPLVLGPPGVGKTAPAGLVTQAFDALCLTISAAQALRALVLIGEGLRFNKAVSSYLQQRLSWLVVQVFGFPHGCVGRQHG